MIDASVFPVPVISSKSVLILVLVDLGDVLLYLGIRDYCQCGDKNTTAYDTIE